MSTEIDIDGIPVVVGDNDYSRRDCYRCWQIGKRHVPRTCLVRYNVGTEHEWIAASCTPCLKRDSVPFPTKTLVISTFEATT